MPSSLRFLRASIVALFAFALALTRASEAHASCLAPEGCVCRFSDDHVASLAVTVVSKVDQTALLHVDEVVAVPGKTTAFAVGDELMQFLASSPTVGKQYIGFAVPCQSCPNGERIELNTSPVNADGTITCAYEVDAQIPLETALVWAASSDCAFRVDQALLDAGADLGCDDTGCNVSAGSARSALAALLLGLVSAAALLRRVKTRLPPSRP